MKTFKILDFELGALIVKQSTDLRRLERVIKKRTTKAEARKKSAT